MKKYIILVLIVLLIGALMVGCTTVTPEIDLSRKSANGGVAEKATGSIVIEQITGGGGWTGSCSFNAHEESGIRPAKGKLYWTQTHPIDTRSPISFVVDIDVVSVVGNEAWFEGIATFDVLPHLMNGERLFVHVTDNDTPGAIADRFELCWNFENLTYRGFNVLAGNLVVHTLLPTISSDDLAGPFNVDETGEFSVTTVNPPNGFAYEHVLFNYTMFVIEPTNISSFEYYDEGTATWYSAPVNDAGLNVTGYFGPPAGFPMDTHYDETTLFKIKINTAGTYKVIITLNDLDNGNAVLATLIEDVVVE